MADTEIYKDEAGNKLFKKWISTRNIWQYYAKNRTGAIVNPAGLRELLKKANIDIAVPREAGIKTSKLYEQGLNISKETGVWD